MPQYLILRTTQVSTALINYRLSFTSDVPTEFARITRILAPVVYSHNLSFSVNGSLPDVKNNVVRLEILGSHEQAPTSPTHGEPWRLIGGTVRAVFGEETVVAPIGMIGE